MVRVFRHYLSSLGIALFFLDAVAAALLCYAVFLAEHGLGDFTGQIRIYEEWFQIVLTVVLICMAMYSLGVYDRWHLVDHRVVGPRLAVCYIVCLPLVWLAIRVTAGHQPVPFSATGSYDVVLTSTVFAGVVLIRIAVRAVGSGELLQQRVLVAGIGKQAAEIERLVRSQKNSPTVILGFYPIKDDACEVDRSRIITTNESLIEIVQRTRAKEIVVAVDDRRGMSTERLLEARMAGVSITNYLNFIEREARKVPLEHLDPSWLIYSDGFRVGTLVNGYLKRALDIAISLAFLLFMLPVLAAVSLAVKLDSRGPLLYRQERVGKNGKVFVLFKFRTMRVDAENDGVPRWAQERDPRITRVGAVLRLTRIDEIPQVINVLKGDMSFVGPRPERPFFVEALSREIPYYMERHRVSPGITGWAQINYSYGASVEDARQKHSYDLYYIKNYSVMFDLIIILMTVHVVVWNKGAR
jgi:sugar transferase (PEP-CTERM system associated)